MSLSSIILPILSLIAGIASLFVDPKNPKRKSIIKALILALLLACGFSVYSNYEDHKKADAEITWNKKHINELTGIVKAFRSETKDTFNQVFQMIDYGWSKEKVKEVVESAQVSRAIEISMDADQKRNRLATLTSKSSRENTIVQYFPKNVDKEIVKSALRELGFRLVIGKPNLPHVPTNAIWYGKDVMLKDIKLVAYTLIRAGIEIKVISPFMSPTGKRSNLIQVGSWMKYINSTPLTVSEIEKASSFVTAY